MALGARHIPASRIEDATERAYGQLRARYGVQLGRGSADELLTCFYGLRSLLHPLYQESLRDAERPLESVIAADAYASGIAAREALGERLEQVPVNGYRVEFHARGDARQRETLLLSEPLEQHVRIARSKPGAARASAEQLVKALYVESLRVVDELPSEIKAAASRAPVIVGETTYQGIERVGMVLAPVAPFVHKEVVGNDELMYGMRRILYRVLHADPREGTNPCVEAGLLVPQTSLISGPTGSGKTLALTQLYAEAEEAASLYGSVPVRRHSIGNELKTSLMHDSQNNLRKVFTEMMTVPALHLGLADEFDGASFKRSAISNHQEEYMFVTEYMLGLSRLEPLKAQGNIHIAHITNYRSGMDTAIIGRISEAVFSANGPTTSEELGRVLRNELGATIESGVIAVADWTALGAVAGEMLDDASGRDMKNLAFMVLHEVDKGFYDGRTSLLEQERGHSADAIRGMLRERVTPLDESGFADVMRRYAAMVADEEARVKAEKVDTEASELEISLLARKRLEQRLSGGNL